MSARDLAKRPGRPVGVEISQYRPVGARRAALIERLAIRTVADVGANVGHHGHSSLAEMSGRLDPFFYDPADGRVLSFDGTFVRRGPVEPG